MREGVPWATHLALGSTSVFRFLEAACALAATGAAGALTCGWLDGGGGASATFLAEEAGWGSGAAAA